jgi:hypothetical protein
MVRDPKRQIEEMKVPEEHLNGHAFHTYHVVSPDGMFVYFPTYEVVMHCYCIPEVSDSC